VTLPETDLHRIHTWARGRVPEHLWPELKVEADVADRYVDIVEVRPPWDGVGEHTRFPIARLRYTNHRPVGDLLARPAPEVPRVQAQAPYQERPGAARLHRDQRRPDLLGLTVGTLEHPKSRQWSTRVRTEGESKSSLRYES
jgi:hypothetical protein